MENIIKMAKTLCIVSCFDCYYSRNKFIEQYYRNIGYDVVHIISDFSHSKKIYIEKNRKNVELIHVPSYNKNLSLKRINSHHVFAKNAYKKLYEMKPDMIYCNIPPNFVTKWVARYKKENPDITLIFDIYDLWPESMTKGKGNSILRIPFNIWGGLRDNNINKADYIITECDLYQEVLNGKLDNKKTSTLYVTKESTGLFLEPVQNMEEIHLCYVGSINNIIDISKICDVISKIEKKVIVHIIGLGEKKDEFVQALQNVGTEVNYYGPVYDEEKKYEIFSKCHFGLNIMKESVCVGLTLKSVTYFEAGLPIINNIKSDTYKLVKEYGAGINVDDTDAGEIISNMNLEEYSRLRDGAKLLFDEKLSQDRIETYLKERNWEKRCNI